MFLRNHSDSTSWSELPASVRKLFPSPDGSLTGANFHTLQAMPAGYCFELFIEGLDGAAWRPSDIVLLQDNWGLVSLIEIKLGTGAHAFTLPIDLVCGGRVVRKVNRTGKGRQLRP